MPPNFNWGATEARSLMERSPYLADTSSVTTIAFASWAGAGSSAAAPRRRRTSSSARCVAMTSELPRSWPRLRKDKAEPPAKSQTPAEKLGALRQEVQKARGETLAKYRKAEKEDKEKAGYYAYGIAPTAKYDKVRKFLSTALLEVVSASVQFRQESQGKAP